ncbi:bifunctional phosphopantothenoylcysteine decarboxylase/phosphopantothenate--cysteine ligase CoaBC [Robertmurraya korlensis]|uniref:bifunctional phosphopantothenoylcysteine decarboxylase/phosphopantothenate--cysteine ligase CoaBC n=1 Tax=Robertmurraya korlensis TaxID=519977 RepID=UPI002041A990|nr:bifunctional phosphopantothenoylcysteine decarboxylase/phosphopantothenate--cysteine ligase CoaBC [Robertmurraya korlensis]
MRGKKILLCVSGGIAVFKAAALTSKLTQAGLEVKVILSESASKFVTPLTFQALSRNDVHIDTFDEKNSKVIAHIDLADWADLIVVAPATANVIGKLANGIADNMITTTLLAATVPVWIAPAMNVHMYDHPAVRKNLETLRSYGYGFIEPGEGYLACGYVGKGRMEEPETIVEKIAEFFQPKNAPLKRRKVLVTAGPTREKIDPVRYITNFSSGKMGYAIAEQAKNLGAEVTLITGPVSIEPPLGVKVIHVESAQDMLDATIAQYESSDLVVKTAAVADYKPKTVSNRKIKKQEGNESIELERTKDILLELGKIKKNQVLVGFAAETDHVEEYAMRKLEKKNADIIVANNVAEEGSGFGTDTNKITIYKRDGHSISLPLMTKQEAAKTLLLEALKLLPEEEAE